MKRSLVPIKNTNRRLLGLMNAPQVWIIFGRPEFRGAQTERGNTCGNAT